MLEHLKSLKKSKEWEVEHSSLARLSTNSITYEQCRNYSRMDIVNNLTHMPDNLPFITELPPGTDFNFLVRVDTTKGYSYDPNSYYSSFEERDFISFSTINRKNISHYKYHGRNLLLAYNIPPEVIVHVFPADSDTNSRAKNEEDLTILPSLWLNIEDLNSLTLKLKTYNQITCKTKINGTILKPFAIIVFDEIDDYAISVAKDFGIGCIIVHPDNNALHYNADLYYDYYTTKKASDTMENLYQINLLSHFYPD